MTKEEIKAEIAKLQKLIDDIEDFDDIEYDDEGRPFNVSHGGLALGRYKSRLNELRDMLIDYDAK